MRISQRIQCLSSKVYPYKRIADIGCDHGYTILEILKNQEVEKIVGVENKIGPFNRSKETLSEFSNVQVVLSDGLDSIEEDIECVIIAGMGSDTIINIINKNISKLNFIKRFVVDSHHDIPSIRKVLSSLGYKIIDEEIIEEYNKFYEIITFDKQSVPDYSEIDYLFGPILRVRKSNTFIKKWQQLLNVYYKYPKSFELSIKIKQIEEILDEN